MKARNALVLLVLASGVALAGVGIAHRAREHRTYVDERWRSMLADMDELELQLDARDVARPALWGETTDGRAEPHYDRVYALADALDHDRVRELRPLSALSVIAKRRTSSSVGSVPESVNELSTL